MRILVITQYFWPENFRINDLVAGFCQRGHQVTVLTGMPNYPAGALYAGYSIFRPARERYQGADVVRVPLIPRAGGGGIRLALNFLSFALSALLLAPFRCRGDFDVIFVHEPSPMTVGLPALLMGRIKRAPILFWVLDLWPESLEAAGGVRSPSVLWLVRAMVAMILRNSYRVLVQSRAFIDNIASLGIARDKILYFPSWAEELYRPLPASRALFQQRFSLSDGFYLMFAGNVGVAQDFKAIMRAATRLRDRLDIHWLIVGDGRMASWVKAERAKQQLEKTVHLLGAFPVEEMPQFFAAADALLVSLKDEPIFSLTIPGKVQSYLACGRPVIAMLNGEGGRVIEESEAGMVCASGDDAQLASLLCAMAALPQSAREAMGQRGRAYFESHFEREMLFSQLEQWMEKACYA
ncbi:MAG: glycosyltransferase family 4 protein [Mariprofundales bacterium]